MGNIIPQQGGTGGGDASAANQTNGLQKTQIVDAGGDAVTVTGGKLDVNASVDTTGLATSAKQDTGNSSLSSIDSKTPALGQALAAASTPVVLTAAQITTLTPQTNALTDTQLRANPVPVSGTVTITPSGTQDENIKQVNGNTVNTGAGAAGTGTQRVITATDSTIATVGAVTAITNALPAGSNIIGKVGIDQTTPGTTNGVQVNAALPAGTNAIGKLAANDGVDIGDVTVNNAAGESAVNIQDGGNSITVDYATTGSGTATGALRVELPTNGTGVVGLNSGSNIVGRVGIDQTTPGTTNKVNIGTDGVIATLTNPVGIKGTDGSTISSNTNTFPVTENDSELATTGGMTSLRDRLTAERYTVLADSLADGIAAFWTQSVANGGAVASTGGEGRLTTSTATNGSAQISSTYIKYYPGQVAWMNSAIRFGDTGVVGNIRRIGMFTISGTTPQDGYYYELSGTTLNAVTVKGGSATAVASTSWTKFSTAPFTLDANYHSFEIRYTANSVAFYIDNILRHQVSGTSATLTNTLSFPITITNVKTSGATDITFAIRNIGNGSFGSPAGRAAGANDFAERVAVAFPATAYCYNIPSQVHVAAANTVHWDMFNADATLIVRVVSIRQIPNITTAVTGIVFDWLLERTTAVGTGGTGLTAWLADTLDTALDADITARSKPSGGATQSTDLFNYALSSEETNAATIQVASQGGLELVPPQLLPNFGGKGIVLRQNQGIRCVQVTNSNAGNTGWLISFTVE